MTLVHGTSPEAHAIRELYMGGEWACAHGDFSALRQVARRLCEYAPEVLRDELVELAESCIGDPERAAVLWDRVKTGPLCTAQS